MNPPPPVSGEAFATTVGSEARTNYLSFGMNVTPAYDDSFLPGSGGTPLGAFSYSLSPALSFDRTTPRQHETLSYTPAFNLYQPHSSYSSIGHSASLGFQYRTSPHATLRIQDTFTQTSNVFDQSSTFPGTVVSGSTQIPTTTAIAPFAEQRSNSTSASASYQFSREGMIGAGGAFSTLTYPNPTEATGLSNSQTAGGSAYFSRRFGLSQYAGVGYQYGHNISHLIQVPVETQTHSIDPYYTFALRRGPTFSLSCGVVHFDTVETNLPAYAAWSPTASTSIAWQMANIAFAGSYSRSISSGQGLAGAVTSSSMNASGNFRIARSWGIGLSTSYSDTKNAVPLLGLSYGSGSSISGSISIQRTLSEHFNAGVGYQRLHENYNTIAVIAADPDSDREFVSISYRMIRPLGR